MFDKTYTNQKEMISRIFLERSGAVIPRSKPKNMSIQLIHQN